MKFKLKRILLNTLFIGFVLGAILITKSVIAASTVYEFYTDRYGVTWELKYDKLSGVEDIYIGFFEKPSGVSSVEVPSLDEIRMNVSIPSSINKLTLVDYFEVDGYHPSNSGNPIRELDLSNIIYVNGVSPMIEEDMLTNVIFSDSGTNIGDGVFQSKYLNVINLEKVKSIGASSFKNVEFEDVSINLDSLNSIGDGAFWGSNINSVDINVQYISNNAFRECLNLQRVHLGNSVEAIGDGVFWGDVNLRVFNFGNVTSIGNYVFRDCESFITDISNTKLIRIGDGAFYNTKSYKLDITIPSGVTAITYATFYGSGLKSVNLNNVTYIGSEAFSNCFNLDRVNFGKVKTIDYRAFYNDKKLTSVSLSDSVEVIKTQAFSDCSISYLKLNKAQMLQYEAFANNKLQDVELPKSINVLNESNVFNNNQLYRVTVAYDTMSSGITSNFRTMIGSNYNTISELVILAPYEDGEEAVIRSNYGASRKSYQSNYSGDANTKYGNANSYRNIIVPGYFYGMPALEHILIGDGYEFIGAQAFYTENPYSSYNTDKSKFVLKKIMLPGTIKGIGSMSFAGNLVADGLEMNLPQSLEYIGYQAFFNCPGFTNGIDLMNLRVIGTNAFMYSGISYVFLHDKLEFVGGSSFKGTFNVKRYIIDCDLYGLPYSGDSYSYGGVGVQNFYSYFDNQNKYELIKFTEKVVTEPCGGFDNYNARSFMYRLKAEKLLMEDCKWTKLGESFLQEAEIDYITLPKNLEIIRNTAFLNATIGNEEVDFPDTVTTIGNDAFHGTKIKIDQLSSNLVSIGYAAFYDCDFNANPVVPKTVTSIGRSSFMSSGDVDIHRESFTFECNLTPDVTQGQTINQLMYNTKVDKLYFGAEVVELPTNTYNNGSESEFYGMSVKEAKFEALKVLPAKAFQDCKELTTVDFSEDKNLTEIQTLAFYNDEKLSKIKFYNSKSSTIKLGESSFRNTGFTSIGGSDTGFDLTAANFITPNMYVFSESKKLETLYIPNGFNNNVIPEYTFWDCTALKKVDIDYKIETIKSNAFAGDKMMESIFLWGDTEIIQEEGESTEFTTSNNITIYNNSTDGDLSLKIIDSVKGEHTITASDFVASGNYKVYTYTPGTNSTISFEYSEKFNVVVSGYNGKYSVSITDFDPSYFTIPSNADIYTYSTYENKEWDSKYEKYRRSEVFNTNSTFYPLDEVLYLTSNRPAIYINEGDTDFDKSKLVVYALRRDGIILESSKWHEYTNHYARKNSEVVFEELENAESLDKAMIVYDTLVPEDIVDVSTENFESMTYQFVDKSRILGTKDVLLFYTDKYTQNVLDTDIRPSILAAVVNTGAKISALVMIMALAIIGFMKKYSKENRKIYKI